MRILFLGLFVLAIGLTNAQQTDYPIQSIPFTKVKVNDSFWLPRIKVNHTATIPASFERCETTGRLKNFEMAAARSGAFCTIYTFDDTDIYKTIEGASFSLSLFPDPKLDAYLDSLITKIEAAQESDGYLYTARTINPLKAPRSAGKERWEKERDGSHELYNAGHLYEAAVAHFQATGKRNLLNIAIKNADLVCGVFGPAKKHMAPGHQVIEMGLVKLYRVTKKKEYLETAQYFIEERGHHVGYDSTNRDPWKNGAYWQDHKPAIQQREAVGHAVRAGYLYAGMADIAALTGNQQFLTAIDSIWNNVVSKKMYLQGGVGAIGNGERFGDNYELPNATAYNETCAAIANVYWNHRMFLLHGDSKYIDILEKSLYNGLISGVSMDGKSFFYTNAMEIKNTFTHPDIELERAGWFPCSCCPTNITRLIPSVPGYAYAIQNTNIYVNLFINGQTSFLIGNKPIELIQSNNYPWDGALKIQVNTPSATAFNLLVRIPGWASNAAMPSNLYSFQTPSEKKVTITVNGKPVSFTVAKGYAVLNRSWKKGDVVEVNLPMEIRRVVANQKVTATIGKVALQYGPLIYCAEWSDNNGQTSNIILPASATLTPEFKPDLLNGIVVLKGEAQTVQITSPTQVTTTSQPFVAIPYYAWAHRGKGEMAVWLPERITTIDLISK